MRIHYSWIIVIITFFTINVVGIVTAAGGVFLTPIEEEFGWNRSIISLAFGLTLFCYGFLGPFMAAIVEKFGLKKMMVLSMSVLIIGNSLTFVMNQSWQIVLIWGIIIGLGSSVFLTALNPYIVNHWFYKKRGLVTGILTAGLATGQLVLLPLLASIIENFSWRWAMALIILLNCIIFVVILIFMKSKPEDIGLLPYGQTKTDFTVTTQMPKDNPVKVAVTTLLEAVKVKEFWLLAGSFFVCGLSTTGLMGTHFISYCISFGIPLVTSASLLSFMGIFNIAGTTISGWLSDRFDNRWLLFWYYFLRGVSLLFLPFALMRGEFSWLIVFIVFFGLDWIATVPPTINIARQTFGIQKTTIIYGWVLAFHQLGSLTASYAGGVIYQIFNTYTWAFAMAGVFCLLSSLFVLGIKKYKVVQLN